MINTYGEYLALCDDLKELAKAYDNGNAKVPDAVYDAKYRELKAYEIKNPDLALEDSPTKKVYGAPTDGFRKVEHKVPMISITNANGIDEAVAWVKSVKEQYGVRKVELEYKLDGAGLALIYKDGTLIDAVTRGQNNIGDSVAENAVRIAGVQDTIKRKGDVEIRGEALWFYDDFDAFNEQLEADGKKAISNPRNGAAASLKLKNPKEVEQRKLTFVSYIVAQGSESDTQTGDVEYLESEGFKVPTHMTIDISGPDGLERFRQEAEGLRNFRFNMPYAIDGVVIKVDDKSIHDEMGYTSKAPNFYKAYKFPPEEKDTELLDIENSIGRSGAITPVAVVAPVKLAMTTVQRCSLHNWDLVEYLGLFKGCHVTIRKAGEIIPELVKCVETGLSKDDYDIIDAKHGKVEKYTDRMASKRLVLNKEFYTRPDVCPFCGAQMKNATNEAGDELVAWVCDNPECTAQMVEKLCHFVSRNVMNIRGMGEAMVQQLYDAKKIGTYDDIYSLTAKDLEEACGCREKMSKKILDEIEKSKGNYLHQWIEGFGITGIGHTASPVIAECIRKCGGMDMFFCNQRLDEKLAEFCAEALKAGLTQTLADKFATFVKNQQVMLTNLKMSGVTFPVKENAVKSDKLVGKVCIMTGVFEKLGRDEFKKMVVENGGTICSGISKKTNIVLMGDGAGPKKVQAIADLQKAGYQITVYTPETLDDFLNLIV